jgi:DNA-binding MarR family transcriptional regulator
MPQSMEGSPGAPPLIGALLRVPSQAIHRRLIRDLNAAGFAELSLPHMAVLQFPGPDGVRPSVLAERAGISKQAMNQLLGTLEGLGYIARSALPHEGGARIVRLTRRGHAACAKMADILRDIEREWTAELGPKRFGQLKALLALLWHSPPGAVADPAARVKRKRACASSTRSRRRRAKACQRE